jgi:hypothetical protein
VLGLDSDCGKRDGGGLVQIDVDEANVDTFGLERSGGGLLTEGMQRLTTTRVAEAVETVCVQLREHPVAAMANGLVDTYVDAKTARVEASRALYLIAAELDTADLLWGYIEANLRCHGRTAGHCGDADFADLPALRTQLATMCRAYLQAVAIEKPRLRLNGYRVSERPFRE